MHLCNPLDVSYSTQLSIFLVLAFLKYFRLLVNCISYWSYRPIPIPEDPRYSANDVTVVIPSLDGDGNQLREAIRSVLHNDPFKVIIVTVDANRHKAEAMANFFGKRIEVHSIPRANKRLQMCQALPFVETEFTIFADDDVLWPSTLLPWMLAPFEKDSVGGVGTSQRLRREAKPNFWNFLGAAYLLRRNWDIVSCNFIDGGLPCLSGRTVAYRTRIVRDAEFEHAFTHETWRSYQLNADDDNFLTRWLMNNGWDICIQKHRECEVETTLENNSKFLLQCHRWSRSNWRSNIKSLVSERTVWRRHLWSTWAVFLTTLVSWSLVYDLFLAWTWWTVTEQNLSHACSRAVARAVVYFWIVLGCRLVKYLEHFARYPSDVIYIPVIPLFGYYHSVFIKARALFSLQVTTWGSREGADADDDQRLIRLPPYYSCTQSSTDYQTLITERKPAYPNDYLESCKITRKKDSSFADFGPLADDPQPHLASRTAAKPHPHPHQHHHSPNHHRIFGERHTWHKLTAAFRFPRLSWGLRTCAAENSPANASSSAVKLADCR